MTMAIEQDIADIKKDIEYIKNALDEGYELSDEAKAAIKKARATPKSEYVKL